MILSVLFFILTAIPSFGQEEGRWIEETIDPETGLRTGKIEVDGRIHWIRPFANIKGHFLVGVDLSRANLRNADLRGTNFTGANLAGADLRDSDLRGADIWRALDANDSALFAGDRLSVSVGQSEFWEASGGPSTAGADTRFTHDRAEVSDMDLDIYNLGEIRKLKLLKPELLSNDQVLRDSITANTTKIDELDGILTTADETLEAFSQNLDVLNENDQSIGEQLTTLGQNDILIGEQMTILGQNDQSISEQMATLSENDQSISEQMATLSENDQSIMAEINAMKAQLQTLVAQVAEKDQRIAELEQGGGGQSLEQVLEQVRDARAGSVVLTVDPEGDSVTLGLTIEQSDNLTEWTKLDGEMTRTIPIPDGKKFYRFALDK